MYNEKNFRGDGGYRKTFVEDVKKYLELEVEISEKITPHGWQVISPRWIVEPNFGLAQSFSSPEQKLRILDVVCRGYGQNFSYPYIAQTLMNTPSYNSQKILVKIKMFM